MPGFIGRLIEVGIGREAENGGRGFPVEPEFWIDKMNCTVEDKHEIVIDESTIGRIEDSIDGKKVLEGAEGEISGKMRDISFGLLLLAAIGDCEDGPSNGAYEHTFSVKNDAQHPSLTIEVKNPNQQLAFALAMIESLEIRAEVGKYVEYTATFKSKKGEVATNDPDYTLEENPFLAKLVSLKMADTVAELDGVEPIPVKSMTLRISKNLERDDTFGSMDPADILNKQFSIECTIVGLYKDTTFKNLYGGKQAVRLAMESEGGATLTIDLAQVLFTNWEKTTGSDDLSVQTLTGKATYSLTEAMMMSCILVNDYEEYIPSL